MASHFFKNKTRLVVPILCFTGFNSDLTKNGQKMLEKCTEEMTKVSVWLVRCQQQNVTQWQHTKELEQLEKEINPLLGDKPQPALSYLLKKAVERMKEVPEVSQFELQNTCNYLFHFILQSWPFHYPVSAKKLPDYRMIITRPMDLDTMKKVSSTALQLTLKHCERHHYLSREEFLVDTG